MLKKTITYQDWNGTTRTEDFYFNLTQTECAELEYSGKPGESMSSSITTLIQSRDMGTIIKTIKDILLKAYGEKTPDGRRFIKNAEVREAFEQSAAFDKIYMELATNAEYAAEFISGIMPTEAAKSLGNDPKQTILDRMDDFTKTGTLNMV